MGRQPKSNDQRAREQTALMIRNLVQAGIEDSWSGSYDPADAKSAELDYRAAKLDMRQYLNDLYPDTKPATGEEY